MHYIIIGLIILILVLIYKTKEKENENYENIERFPRIIHQIFFSFTPGATIPEKWAENHQVWKDMHPDWEVILWDEESSRELITEMDSSFLKTYDNFKYPIQRVDAIRPFILKKYGGVYVDLDTYPKHSIDNLLSIYEISPKIEVITGPGTPPATCSNWLMISKKNSEFWDLTIQQMKIESSFSAMSRHTEIMWTTGPMMITEASKIYGKDKIVAIDKKLLSDCSVCDSEETCEEKSLYIVNEQSKSWYSSDSSFIDSIYCAFK